MTLLALYGLKRGKRTVNQEVGEAGRQAKWTDHLKTTSCKSLMANRYESWDFLGLCASLDVCV